jgi:uncharacterized integral membrane protein
MRVICCVLLLIGLAAVAVLAVQNSESVSVNYLAWSVGLSLPLLVLAAYGLGMVSGWTVFGLVKRSLHGATEGTRNRS